MTRKSNIIQNGENLLSFGSPNHVRYTAYLVEIAQTGTEDDAGGSDWNFSIYYEMTGDVSKTVLPSIGETFMFSGP